MQSTSVVRKIFASLIPERWQPLRLQDYGMMSAWLRAHGYGERESIAESSAETGISTVATTA